LPTIHTEFLLLLFFLILFLQGKWKILGNNKKKDYYNKYEF